MRLLLLILISYLSFGSSAEVVNVDKEKIKQFTNAQALAISQAAIGKTVGNYEFISSNNKVISLKSLSGKPLIISLVYTSCYNICPTTTENLSEVVEKAKDVLGKESFNVLTIGFDTLVDTPSAMAQFASLHSTQSDNWLFLSSDPATMNALARDLGFIYRPTLNGFDHMIQASILDKDLKVYRQVYGIVPKTPHFVEPIKELVFGEVQNDSLLSIFSSKIHLFCTIYDPAIDRYYFNYSFFVGVFVGLVLAIYFIRVLLREWRYTKSRSE